MRDSSPMSRGLLKLILRPITPKKITDVINISSTFYESEVSALGTWLLLMRYR